MYNVSPAVCEILPERVTLEDLSFDVESEVVFVNLGTANSLKIYPQLEKLKKRQVNILLDFFRSAGVDLRLEDALGALHVILLEILLKGSGKQIILVGNTGFTRESILFLKQNFALLMGKFSEKTILIYDEKVPKAKVKIDFKRDLLL